MGNATDLFETEILNLIVNGNTHVALFTSNPTESGISGIEVSTSGTGYVRQPVTWTPPVQVGGKGTIYNQLDIEFPIASASYGTITHYGIIDSVSGGDMKVYGEFDIPKEILSGDRFTILLNNAVISAD